MDNPLKVLHFYNDRLEEKTYFNIVIFCLNSFRYDFWFKFSQNCGNFSTVLQALPATNMYDPSIPWIMQVSITNQPTNHFHPHLMTWTKWWRFSNYFLLLTHTNDTFFRADLNTAHEEIYEKFK